MKWRRVHFVILGLAVWICFFPSLSGEFLNWDDHAHVVDNPAVRPLSLASLKDIFVQRVQKTYVPLTTLSFALERQVFGFNSFIFHFDNVLLHMVNVWLAYLLMMRLGLTARAALCGALIFAIHPMRVESVAWITERKDLLYTFFYIWAMLMYLRYIENSERKYLSAVFGLGFLSLLSKPMALSLPLVLLLIDWYCKRTVGWKMLVEKAVLAFAFLPIVLYTYVLHSRNPIQHLGEAMLTWIWTAVFYIRKFFWPAELIPIYPSFRPAEDRMDALVACGMGIFILWSLRLNRQWRFAVLFYMASIFFLLRFDAGMDIHFVADRFLYLPAFGLCLWIGWSLDGLIRRKARGRHVIKAIALCVLVALGFKTFQLSGVWRDSISLWTYVIERNPKEFIAYNDRAAAYADKGLYREAINDYSAILDFDPSNVDAFFNRGLAYAKAGDETRAIADFNQVEASHPDYPKTYVHRGRIYMAQGRLDKALNDFNRAIALLPHDAEVYNDRGNLYLRHKRFESALADYSQSLHLKPDFGYALNNRGVVLAKMGRKNEAIDHFNRAIAVNPFHAEAYFNRSVLLSQLEEYREAYIDAMRAKNYGASIDTHYLQKLEQNIPDDRNP